MKDVYLLMVQDGVYICSEHIPSSENSSTSDYSCCWTFPSGKLWPDFLFRSQSIWHILLPSFY